MAIKRQYYSPFQKSKATKKKPCNSLAVRLKPSMTGQQPTSSPAKPSIKLDT